jgi:ribosomal protein S3AE
MLAYDPNEKKLDRVYEIKDLKALTHFLGIEMTRDLNVTKIK